MDHVAGSFNTSAGSKKGGRFFNWGYQQPPRHRAQQWHKQKDMNASRRFNGFDCTVIEADSDCPRGSFSSPPPSGRSVSNLSHFLEHTTPTVASQLHSKVGELACKYPGLKNLCSDDLSQSSWLSVAWYPIYRIPTGPTLRDLGASFLTYHSLSTLFTSGGKGTTTASQDFKDYQYSGGGKGTTIDSQDSMGSLNGSPIRLSPFGLASYKFRGAVWSCSGVVDRQRTSLLLRSSDEWLRGLGVYHPDFDYFMSHCYPARC